MKARQRLAVAPAKGINTRWDIVNLAMHIAAREGLGAISIGRLARELKMSKSGLFVHFGSKESLEAAIVERAREMFSGHILLPATTEVRKGIERVWALCDFWLDFVKEGVLPGGYFFTGAFFECAQQEGIIPKRITEIAREWLHELRRAVDEARSRMEIRRSVDARQTAFELNSILIGAQWSYLMAGKDHTQARSIILAKISSVATEQVPAKAFESVRDWGKYLENRCR